MGNAFQSVIENREASGIGIEHGNDFGEKIDVSTAGRMKKSPALRFGQFNSLMEEGLRELPLRALHWNLLLGVAGGC